MLTVVHGLRGGFTRGGNRSMFVLMLMFFFVNGSFVLMFMLMFFFVHGSFVLMFMSFFVRVGGMFMFVIMIMMMFMRQPDASDIR